MIPKHAEHPLKRQLRDQGLALWQIRQLMGKRAPSEGRLSRMLNGILTLTPEVQANLEAILRQVRNGADNG